MTKPNEVTALHGAMPLLLHIATRWRGASQLFCSVAFRTS